MGLSLHTNYFSLSKKKEKTGNKVFFKSQTTTLPYGFYAFHGLLLLIFILTATGSVNAQTIRYVKAGDTGIGTLWTNASGDLQAMINASAAGDQVWVAAGIYQPALNQSFSMKEGVKIYGGFAGTTESSLSQRDLSAGNSSILKGNGNSVINNSSNNLTAASVLDGFTITSGNADNGGGMLNSNASPTIMNCYFQGNAVDNAGGGIFNDNASPVIIDCIFSGNTATQGGGIYNDNASSPSLTNLTITDNTAGGSGGGIGNENASSPIITNCIIYGNSNGIYSFQNSIPVVTYSLVQGLAADPTAHIPDGTISYDLFVDATNGNYQLVTGSPAINGGTNAALPAGISTDLAGNFRITNGTIDMGAYEYQGVVPVALIDFTAVKAGNTSKLEWTTASEINNKEFVMYRSSDGITFTEIGSVAGSGTTSLPKNYIFYDNDPADGINYYRLQQVDMDGKITDNGIRTVRFSFANNNIKVYPNPAESEVKIEFGAGRYRGLELTDNTGKVLQRITLGINDREKVLQLSNYPAGIYLIKLTGDSVATEKIIKK